MCVFLCSVWFFFVMDYLHPTDTMHTRWHEADICSIQFYVGYVYADAYAFIYTSFTVRPISAPRGLLSRIAARIQERLASTKALNRWRSYTFRRIKKAPMNTIRIVALWPSSLFEISIKLLHFSCDFYVWFWQAARQAGRILHSRTHKSNKSTDRIA